MVIWAGYVTISGQWGRVAGHWQATLTMVFGSFVAGSTPQGGGAVAFPVFTKVLEVPPPVARSFSLFIQAIGMVTASAIIILARRNVEYRAVLGGGLAGVAGFLFTLFALSDPNTPFWSSTIPGPYVKVTFTVLLAAMSYIVFLSLRTRERGQLRIPECNSRVWLGIVVAGFIGGIAAALTGSGVDVLLFLFIVVLAGLHPRVGVPTSIIAMAMTSVVAFVVLGVIDGQLNTVVSSGQVISVGGQPVEGMPAGQFDIFGLWLASIPVVIWGAPLGAWVAHILTEERLIVFVAAIAAAEVISTIIFLDELHSDRALAAYGALALIASIAAIRYLARHRHRILGLSRGGERAADTR